MRGRSKALTFSGVPRIGLPSEWPFQKLDGKQLMDEVVRAVGLHLDLFQDDAFFLLDVFRPEGGVKDEIRQDIEGLVQVLVENLGIEADQFLGGEGVEIAADGIHRAGNVFGRALGGALKEHVLDKVRDAVLLDVLTA